MRYLAAILFALALLGAPAVFADHTPDTIEITEAWGYGDLNETGDILLLVQYNVDYDTLPSNHADAGILARYLDGTTPIRASAPVVYVRQGWGNGVIAVYFDAADASGFSIAYNDADSAQLIGNPAVFGSPWSRQQLIEWRAQGTVTGRDTLEADILDIALDLETKTEWDGVNLIQFDTGDNVLQTAGEDYFENSIPRLRQLAPDLFSAVQSDASVITQTHNTDYQDSLDALWDTTGLTNSFDGMASWTGVDTSTVKTVLSAIAIVVIISVGAGLMIKGGVDRETTSGAGLLMGAILMVLFAGQGLIITSAVAVMGLFGLFIIGNKIWPSSNGVQAMWSKMTFWLVSGGAFMFMLSGTSGIASTTLSAAVDADDLYIPISSASGLPSSSERFFIEEEEIAYDSIQTSSDTNCATAPCLVLSSGDRGINGTAAASHASGKRVYTEIAGLANVANTFRISEFTTGNTFRDIFVAPVQIVKAITGFVAKVVTWDWPLFEHGNMEYLRIMLLFAESAGFIIAVIILVRRVIL